MPEDRFDILEVVISSDELLCQTPGPHHVLGQEVAPAQTLPGVKYGGGEEGISSLGAAHTNQAEREEEEKEGNV